MPMGGQMPLTVGGNKKQKGGIAKGTAGKGYGKGGSKKGGSYRDAMMSTLTKGKMKMDCG